MSSILGKLAVSIVGQMDDLDKTFKAASKQINKFAKETAAIGSSISAAGRDLTTFITLPLAGVGAAAFKSSMDFEAGMSGIKAVSGATADELLKFKELAIEMGLKTKYSASEAAGGIEELVKAGVSMEDILGGRIS